MLLLHQARPVIEVVRAMLEKNDRTIQLFDDSGQQKQTLDGNFILEQFAAGIPAHDSIQELIEKAVFPDISNAPSENPSLNAGLHWLISIFDSLHDGVLIADRNTYVRYINKSFERISGASFDNVVGRLLLDARPGARLGEVIRTGTPMFGIRRKFGSIEYLTDMHPLIINGVCMGGVTIARDITEVQQLQTKLSQYHSRVNDLLRQVYNANAPLYSFADIFGNSPGFVAIKNLAEKLARTLLPILLRGESGTGKELFAHAIHHSSERSDQPFVIVNCAAIPDSLLESELFGYAEGAFSGAKKGGKPGLITLADHGTLFLDEIGDMGIELQAKLLRVLQTQEVQPLGAIRKNRVDVRFIAATNAKLEQLIIQGKFREDLFYRINVAQLHIPPLRERKEDIIPMANFFLARNPHRQLGQLELDDETLRTLENFSWPGNVRELENTIRFIANITDRRTINPHYLPRVFIAGASAVTSTSPAVGVAKPLVPTLRTDRDERERQSIITALEQFGRTVEGKKAAAKSLGISLTTLYGRIRYLRIV